MCASASLSLQPVMFSDTLEYAFFSLRSLCSSVAVRLASRLRNAPPPLRVNIPFMGWQNSFYGVQKLPQSVLSRHIGLIRGETYRKRKRRLIWRHLQPQSMFISPIRHHLDSHGFPVAFSGFSLGSPMVQATMTAIITAPRITTLDVQPMTIFLIRRVALSASIS